MRWTGIIRCEGISASRKNSEGSLLESMKRWVPDFFAKCANAPPRARAPSRSAREASQLWLIIAAKALRMISARSDQRALLQAVIGDARFSAGSAGAQNRHVANFSPQAQSYCLSSNSRVREISPSPIASELSSITRCSSVDPHRAVPSRQMITGDGSPATRSSDIAPPAIEVAATIERHHAQLWKIQFRCHYRPQGSSPMGERKRFCRRVL